MFETFMFVVAAALIYLYSQEREKAKKLQKRLTKLSGINTVAFVFCFEKIGESYIVHSYNVNKLVPVHFIGQANSMDGVKELIKETIDTSAYILVDLGAEDVLEQE